MTNYKKTVLTLKQYLLTLVFIGISFWATSQDCNQNLESANRAYYNGQFEKIEPLLSGCIESGFDKQQKAEALRLLINSFLVLKKDQTADKYLDQLLKTQPEYELKSNDLPEFRKLYETYKIKTRFTIGFLGGILFPDYQIMRYHSYASETKEPVDYEEKTGWTMGINGDAAIVDRFFLNLSILYQTSSFHQEEIILNYQRVASDQKEVRLSFPVQIRYIYEMGNWRAFLGGGVSMHYLLSSKADLLHVPLEPEFPKPFIGVPVFATDYDLIDIKKRVTWNTVLSGGIQLKVGKMILEGRFTFERGLNNIIDEDRRFSDSVLLDDFAFVPDDYKLDNYILTLAILRNFVIPVKKKAR